MVCTVRNNREYVGELQPEDVKDSMLHLENRHLEIMAVNDFDSVSLCLETLMGKDVESRRDYLFENVDFSILNR